MSVVAVYNMKGGVGKTTTAVNLSYLAATAGQRTLLWDLDPQGASSFAFRIRPRVAGFGKSSLRSGEALAAAIKETDYDNLDLLPADFAYRKLDRLLGPAGNPARVLTALLRRLGRDYDAVFLDCPAGFSRLTEGVFAAADTVLVPTIPTVLSLRMVSRILKWADRSDSPVELAAFFSMVDRRKALHRRACDVPAGASEVFMAGHVPYASVVEQMNVRRMPLPVFAARDAAAHAFVDIWGELQTRLQRRRERGEGSARTRGRWLPPLRAVEALIAELDSAGAPEAGTSRLTPPVEHSGSALERRNVERSRRPAAESAPGAGFVHTFDTDDRDLQRFGYVLEFRESAGSLRVVVARSGDDHDWGETTRLAQARIDSSCAVEILSGMMSPLAALQRRLGTPRPALVEKVTAIVDGRNLHRVESRVERHVDADSQERSDAGQATVSPLAADPRLGELTGSRAQPVLGGSH